ncbi:MAG: M48 family metallopeptidase [Verrucomicrobia bacterium]|nr:M48 family metallopeptidase [Verrucomicrobiota bacterium]
METEYRASAVQAGESSRTFQGRLRIFRESLQFEYDGGRVEMPLAELRVRLGGHNSEHVFFEHRQQPNWSIYTAERSILQHETLRRHSALAEQLQGLQKKSWPGRSMAVAGAVVLLIFVLMLAVAFGNKARVVRYLAFKIPVSAEINLGNSLIEQVKRQGKLLNDSRLEAKLNTITARLLPAVAGTEYRFQFHILDDTNVNAFALPGGNVVVLSGLLNAAGRSEEIAGVLAHEIAHVTERHGFRKIIDAAGLSLIVQTLFGDAGGLMALIADSSEFLLRQKYSRDFEREADDVGWRYLVAAQIDPRGLTEFFRKLMEHEKSGLAIPGLLSTHPATVERIRRLERKWEQTADKSGFVALGGTGP